MLILDEIAEYKGLIISSPCKIGSSIFLRESR